MSQRLFARAHGKTYAPRCRHIAGRLLTKGFQSALKHPALQKANYRCSRPRLHVSPSGITSAMTIARRFLLLNKGWAWPPLRSCHLSPNLDARRWPLLKDQTDLHVTAFYFLFFFSIRLSVRESELTLGYRLRRRYSCRPTDKIMASLKVLCIVNELLYVRFPGIEGCVYSKVFFPHEKEVVHNHKQPRNMGYYGCCIYLFPKRHSYLLATMC